MKFDRPTYEPYLSMANIDGNLQVKPSLKVMETKATYMTDWNGWTKLNTVPISKDSIKNKAKVILDVDPDIILLQQVENRKSLIQFHEIFFKKNRESGYEEIMHLQGNDGKGLGMGILLKRGYHIKSIKSFANERDENGNLLFDNGFLQYKIKTPQNKTLFLLCCQLADNGVSEPHRKQQVMKIAQTYTDLRSKGHQHIIVAGTLNTPSYSDSISAIFESDIMDVVKHNSFKVLSDSGEDAGYYRMGAYRMGVNIKQKDYLLVSPAFYDKIDECGMNRKAMWPLKKPEWETYNTIEKENDAASNHPLLWAKFSLEDSLRLYRKSA
ncbi:hypothetical protein GH721_06925 [Kriegella sp. EG-1]|nr:hypothetical protein [Flavobacteriaceae bacterium EG-1]